MRPDPSDPTTWSATELSTAIAARRLSCTEVMTAFLDRIDAVNPTVNAIISRVDHEALLREAADRDRELVRTGPRGWMHGMPVAVKDLAHTAGIRTTLGSPLFREFVPHTDGLMVQRMKTAGCIVIGKTNVPEFGLGSHTFNEVFGRTGNAYDPTRTAGGSSGGAAVALATGMLPIADGSDFMGSLRNPAAYANVFGFRPSQGRVPGWPVPEVFVSQLVTEGPMGRTVDDVARLLEVQAGSDQRVPLSRTDRFSADNLRAYSSRAYKSGSVRIGWLGDLNGYLATEPGILDVCGEGLRRFEQLGCAVEPVALRTAPEAVWEAWLIWRRWLVSGVLGPFAADPVSWAQLKPEAQWEYDQARGLTGDEVMAASRARSAFYSSMVELFEDYDVVALPTAQVWPFDGAERWPTSVAGRTMDTYHRWMEVVIYATFAGLPCISVPVGFNAEGLPMGMQLIGRPGDDIGVLRVARAYEETIPHLRVGEAMRA